MAQRKLTSRHIVLRELTYDEVEERLVRIRLHDATFVRPRDIKSSKAWFEGLADAQNKYADRMKRLENVSHSGLVGTVDSLAGEVRDLTTDQHRVNTAQAKAISKQGEQNWPA